MQFWSAREGVFERDHVANLDSRTRDRYFERTRATWRIASSLRHHTRWQIADATGVKPVGLWDLVRCRNTAIAALDLFRTIPCGVAVFERNVSNQLRCLASAPYAIDGEASGVTDHFVQLVLAQNRTAGIDDLSLRPDLATASMADNFQFHAVMATPIRFGGEPSAALAIYSTIAHEWTDEEFHLAEWLADQCGRVLQALRVQSDLREADRRKSEFLATLSHELRNPLAPIGFALKLLESGNGDYDNHLPVIKRQVQQLVRLVDDLLDATRLTSNRIQIRKLRADLVPVVRHAVEAARPDVESAGHSLVTIFPAHPVWLDIDADRMAQVVANLLNNAARYTPPGGTVTVSISEDGHQNVLSISDTGIGLDPGDRAGSSRCSRRWANPAAAASGSASHSCAASWNCTADTSKRTAKAAGTAPNSASPFRAGSTALTRALSRVRSCGHHRCLSRARRGRQSRFGRDDEPAAVDARTR